MGGSSFFGVSKTLDFGMDNDSQNQAISNHDQFVDKIHAFKSEMESFATKSCLKLSITAQQQLEVAMNAIHKLEQILRKQPNLERRAKQGHNVSFVARDDDGKENEDDNLLMDCVDDSSNDDSTNNILGSLFL